MERDLTTRALFCRFAGQTGGMVGKFYAERYDIKNALQLFRETFTLRERDAFVAMLTDNMHRVEDTSNAQLFMKVWLASQAKPAQHAQHK